MRKEFFSEELTGRLTFTYPCSSKEIISDVNDYIRSAREKNLLHVFITSISSFPNKLVFKFSAEDITQGFSEENFIPTRFSIVTTIEFSDSITVFLQEEQEKIDHRFGPVYNLKVVGQVMREGDTQILVCLLAEKSL